VKRQGPVLGNGAGGDHFQREAAVELRDIDVIVDGGGFVSDDADAELFRSGFVVAETEEPHSRDRGLSFYRR
jgi:hypothetical protein